MMVSRKVKISNDMVYNGEEEQKCPVEYMEVEKIAESYGMPIAKLQDKELKRLRRRVKNKISAQESRRRKKEYMQTLEHRLRISDQENEQLQQKITHMEAKMRSLVDEMFVLQQTLRQNSHLLNGGSNLRKTKLITRATQTGICLQCYYEGGTSSRCNKTSAEPELIRFPYGSTNTNGFLPHDNFGVVGGHTRQDFRLSYTSPETTIQNLVQANHVQKTQEHYCIKAVEPMGNCEVKERHDEKDSQLNNLGVGSFVVYSSENVILLKDPVVHISKSNKQQSAFTSSKQTISHDAEQRITECNGYSTENSRLDSTNLTNISTSFKSGNFSSNSVNYAKFCLSEERRNGNFQNGVKYESDIKPCLRPNSAALDCNSKKIEPNSTGRIRCFSHPSYSTRGDCNEDSKE